MFFDTLLFDLDDTIHDRDKSLLKFAEIFKLRYSDAFDYGSEFMLKDILVEIDCQGYKPREEMFHELLNRISWKFQPDIIALIEFWNIEFPRCAEPMDNLYEVLDYFSNKNVKMGIITNGNSEFQNAKIDRLNLRKYMKTIIISEEVDLRKPDPEIFHLALSKMNSNSQTSLFVGDNPLWDVKGAIDARLIAIWLSNGQTWNTQEYAPRYIVSNLLELKQI